MIMDAVPMISCKSIWRLPICCSPNLVLIWVLQVACAWFLLQLLLHFANCRIWYRPTTPFCSWFELPLQPKRRCRNNKKSQEPQLQPTLHPSTIRCLLHPFLPHHLTPSLLKEPPHGHPTAAVLDRLLQYPSECASSWPRLSQCRRGVVAFSGSWKPEVLWKEEVDFRWFQSLVTNIDTCIYLKYR